MGTDRIPQDHVTPPPAPRRRFLRAGAAGLSALGALLSGCASWLRPPRPEPEALACPTGEGETEAYDYIVVGSGAGGGPLAANLARSGFRVLLIEAGGDEDSYDYQVPAFHPRASEDPRYAWNFFVRHYRDETRQRRDTKYRPEHGGVLYPRAATLGGCTAHNAMILIYPHNSDWDHIAELTGDQSWHSEHMRRYFERLERCEYGDRNPASRHGYRGWLTTNVADPRLMLRDIFVVRLVKGAVRESLRTLSNPITRLWRKLRSDLDPNDWRLVKDDVEGVCMTPLTTHQGRRVGSREYVQAVVALCPGQLTVRTHTLVSRVVFDDHNRATGVECLAGAHLYRADPAAASQAAGETVRLHARREVILCAGAFNTPQLLKLSGIGPRVELEKHGIDVRVDLPGVGENLQDRYEVTVVNRMRGDFALMKGMSFRPPAPGEAPDPPFREWLDGKGPYTTNGAVVALLKRSTEDQRDPDLFLFGLLGNFRGYYPGYSKDIAKDQNHFTWAVLKAHTHNTAGRVTLRSADPRDTPDIDFHYFDEGTPGGDDMAAVVEGVETVRRMADRAGDVIAEEVYPGPAVAGREAVEAFIRDNAWGHHASCSCRMGPAGDPMAVVDSRFRVVGCQGLRVVDASIFPRIPGFFIVSAVYMVSEKAAEVIVADARRAEAT